MRFLHLCEEESMYRAAVQSECAAFFRGVYATIVTSVTAAIRAAARNRAKVQFFDGEADARNEVEGAEAAARQDCVPIHLSCSSSPPSPSFTDECMAEMQYFVAEGARRKRARDEESNNDKEGESVWYEEEEFYFVE